MSDFGVADQVVQCHTKPKNGDFLTADVYLLTIVLKEHSCCASQSSIDTDQTQPLSAKLIDSNFKIVVPRAFSVSSSDFLGPASYWPPCPCAG